MFQEGLFAIFFDLVLTGLT